MHSLIAANPRFCKQLNVNSSIACSLLKWLVFNLINQKTYLCSKLVFTVQQCKNAHLHLERKFLSASYARCTSRSQTIFRLMQVILEKREFPPVCLFHFSRRFYLYPPRVINLLGGWLSKQSIWDYVALLLAVITPRLRLHFKENPLDWPPIQTCSSSSIESPNRSESHADADRFAMVDRRQWLRVIISTKLLTGVGALIIFYSVDYLSALKLHLMDMVGADLSRGKRSD